MRFHPSSAITLAVLALVAQARAQTAAPAVELNKVTVTGEGDKLGTGLMMEEDAAKSRSSVTKAQLEKTRSSGNPFQALTLLPGVNATSYDATGLFGGNLRVRGYNSDQMGFTVNGAPVNDSGNFAVYPQEYIDQENLCSLYVTQGAADTDAPHVGASGGNVGILSCAPEDVQRTRVAVSAGQLDFYRLFARFDTGKVGPFKGFVSVSKSSADKWKGFGKADREHLDTAGEWDFGSSNKITATALVNHQVTNNFISLPLFYTAPRTGTANPATPTYANRGYYADFGNTIPQHMTPVNGTAQNESTTAPNPAYYGYALNPFDNALLTVKGSFALTERLRLEVLPYYWYGFGTGGTQQVTIAESSGGTNLHGGIADINRDGDTRDTVLAYRGSVTDTNRPGIISSLTYVIDNHKINGGFWFERARHRQTQPATRVDNAGNIGAYWLNNPDQELRYNDGALYQGRDWTTISTGESLFVQDVVDLVDGRLLVTPAFSYRRIKREFTNIANSGTNGGVDYGVDNTYGKPLPSLSLSFQATPDLQVFASGQRNFRTPSNFEFGNLGRGITFANGVGTLGPGGRIIDLGVVPETSWNYDAGARLKTPWFRASGTVFYNKIKNRIASSFNPNDNSTTDQNVGPSTTKGVELELGSVPLYGFSAYVSGTYTRSRLEENLTGPIVSGANIVYATSGKQFPDTPKGMASLALQYASGPFLVELAGKYTSGRFITLVNDTRLPSYTLWDLNAGFKLPNAPGNTFKNPTLRLNVSNIFSKKYYIANAGSGSNIQPDAYGNASVYTGAPRFASVTFQVDY